MGIRGLIWAPLLGAALSSCAATGHFAAGIAPQFRHADEGNGPPQAAGMCWSVAPETVESRLDRRSSVLSTGVEPVPVGRSLEDQLAELTGVEEASGPLRLAATQAVSNAPGTRPVTADLPPVRPGAAADVLGDLREERRLLEELAGRERGLRGHLPELSPQARLKAELGFEHARLAAESLARASAALNQGDAVLAQIELMRARMEREAAVEALSPGAQELGWRR